MSLIPFEIEEIDLLADRLPAFEFDCLIAEGNTGVFYKARQRSLDRDVAIKILPRELGADPLFRSSFQAEAKAMASLTHPNLIRVYDYGDLDGMLYMVMEYVPGKSLYHSAHGKVIDSKQAVEIVIAACRGLAHAHENGIVHRDIKPANILLTPRCEPKIGEFGLARCNRTDGGESAMGTAAYMAPELLVDPAKGGPQSDVFAIGMVLRELLTGIPAGTEESAGRVVSDPMLAAICRTATHGDPASRFPDASALAQQLADWMKPKASRAVVNTNQPAIKRPMAPARRAVPTRITRQGSSSKGSLFKFYASFSLIACSSYLAWGFYQTRQEAIVWQQKNPGSRISIQLVGGDSNPVARFTPSGDLETEPSAAVRESSFESLVRFGTNLVAGNSQ